MIVVWILNIYSFILGVLDFCKTISGGVNYSSSDGEGENYSKQCAVENDEADIFIHSFLRSRDKDARIVLNIRVSKLKWPKLELLIVELVKLIAEQNI